MTKKDLYSLNYSLDRKKRIVYSVALIPDYIDFYGDVLTVEEVEDLSHDFLINSRGIDIEHDFKVRDDIYVVESWLFKEDTTLTIDGVSKVFPVGTWALGMKINDKEIWQGFESGLYTGLSVSLFRERDRKLVDTELNFSKKSSDDEEINTIEDLKGDGEKIYVATVSAVGNPAFADALAWAKKSLPNADFVRIFEEVLERSNKNIKGDLDMNKKDLRVLIDNMLSIKSKVGTKKISKKSKYSKKEVDSEDLIKEFEDFVASKGVDFEELVDDLIAAKSTVEEEEVLDVQDILDIVAEKTGIDVEELVEAIAEETDSTVVEVLTDLLEENNLDVEEVLEDIATEKSVEVSDLVDILEEYVSDDSIDSDVQETIEELREEVASLKRANKGTSNRITAVNKGRETKVDSMIGRSFDGRRINKRD